MFNSFPEKLAILPGMKDLNPSIFDLKINSKIISIATTVKIIAHIL